MTDTTQPPAELRAWDANRESDRLAKASADRRGTARIIRERARYVLKAQGHTVRTIDCAEGLNTPLWQKALETTA